MPDNADTQESRHSRIPQKTPRWMQYTTTFAGIIAAVATIVAVLLNNGINIASLISEPPTIAPLPTSTRIPPSTPTPEIGLTLIPNDASLDELREQVRQLQLDVHQLTEDLAEGGSAENETRLEQVEDRLDELDQLLVSDPDEVVGFVVLSSKVDSIQRQLDRVASNNTAVNWAIIIAVVGYVVSHVLGKLLPPRSDSE